MKSDKESSPDTEPRDAHDLDQSELIAIAQTAIEIVRNRTNDSDHIDALAGLIDSLGCLNDQSQE
jgi:hypothetical protein